MGPKGEHDLSEQHTRCGCVWCLLHECVLLEQAPDKIAFKGYRCALLHMKGLLCNAVWEGKDG
jgi:hypothetical protein